MSRERDEKRKRRPDFVLATCTGLLDSLQAHSVVLPHSSFQISAAGLPGYYFYQIITDMAESPILGASLNLHFGIEFRLSGCSLLTSPKLTYQPNRSKERFGKTRHSSKTYCDRVKLLAGGMVTR